MDRSLAILHKSIFSCLRFMSARSDLSAIDALYETLQSVPPAPTSASLPEAILAPASSSADAAAAAAAMVAPSAAAAAALAESFFPPFPSSAAAAGASAASALSPTSPGWENDLSRDNSATGSLPEGVWVSDPSPMRSPRIPTLSLLSPRGIHSHSRAQSDEEDEYGTAGGVLYDPVSDTAPHLFAIFSRIQQNALGSKQVLRVIREKSRRRRSGVYEGEEEDAEDEKLNPEAAVVAQETFTRRMKALHREGMGELDDDDEELAAEVDEDEDKLKQTERRLERLAEEEREALEAGLESQHSAAFDLNTIRLDFFGS